MDQQVKIITLDSKFCQFQTEDTSLFSALNSHLSFKALGVEYSAAYKRGWNGITCLMNKKGIFPSGLLPKVRLFLTKRGAVFTEEDRRTSIVIAEPLDLTSKLQSLSMMPREHQVRTIDTAVQYNKGIVRAATGSGKTLSIALLTAKFNKPTLILVIGLDLLQQFHDLFSKLFEEPIGFIGNGECRIERINIATIWAARSLKIDKKSILSDDEESGEENFDESQSDSILKMLKEAKVIILDESHVATTNTIKEIHKAIDPEYIYGFSGTPFRDDNTDLLINGVLGEQIINVNASELIEKGLLVQPLIRFIEVPKMRFHGGANYQTVYKEYVVENDIRNSLIIQHTKSLLDKGYTPLILFKQIKHGKKLFELMQEQNIKCEMLYGNDSLERRNEVKEILVNGKINAILASVVFDMD